MPDSRLTLATAAAMTTHDLVPPEEPPAASVAASGPLDLYCAADLNRRIAAAAADSGGPICVDLREATSVDLSILALLVDHGARLGTAHRRLRVLAPAGTAGRLVRRAAEVSGRFDAE